MKAVEKPWIENGYRIFAYDGPKELKIERIAKAIGKNKSSFYHLFADLEVFNLRLLEYHFEMAGEMVAKEAKANSEEELVNVLVEHKLDLLFNRQLRVHRENPDFDKCFNRINELFLPTSIPLWKKIIGLPENNALAGMVLQLSLENFFIQITDETLNKNWLHEYFAGIRQMVKTFRQLDQGVPLDGSV